MAIVRSITLETRTEATMMRSFKIKLMFVVAGLSCREGTKGIDGDDVQIESDSENANEIQTYLGNMRDIWDEKSADVSGELTDDDVLDWYKPKVSIR
jgi:hypothetical protein